ncbi:MAG: hypothetical protein QM426_02805 [Euryarchaeota archaeon]|nr:hypothetical protein [Euryarchaeota archaeon]
MAIPEKIEKISLKKNWIKPKGKNKNRKRKVDDIIHEMGKGSM